MLEWGVVFIAHLCQVHHQELIARITTVHDWWLLVCFSNRRSLSPSSLSSANHTHDCQLRHFSPSFSISHPRLFIFHTLPLCTLNSIHLRCLELYTHSHSLCIILIILIGCVSQLHRNDSSTLKSEFKQYHGSTSLVLQAAEQKNKQNRKTKHSLCCSNQYFCINNGCIFVLHQEWILDTNSPYCLKHDSSWKLEVFSICFVSNMTLPTNMFVIRTYHLSLSL